MSNLGEYQNMTTRSKMVGGPIIYQGLLIGAGIIIGTVGSKLPKWVSKWKKKTKSRVHNNEIYKVKSYAVSNEGLQFSEGDTFRVLQRDKDAVLIEKTDDPDQPHFVDYELLKQISDYCGD